MKRGCQKSGGNDANRLLALSLVLLGVLGCHTLPPLAPANFSEPDWRVRQGQAVWRSGRSAPEIAGEILVATRTNGDSFIQFTKTPFPLVVAQQTGHQWEIQFPTENKRYSRRGNPPIRLIWFWLARALTGEPLPKKFLW